MVNAMLLVEGSNDVQRAADLGLVLDDRADGLEEVVWILVCATEGKGVDAD